MAVKGERLQAGTRVGGRPQVGTFLPPGRLCIQAAKRPACAQIPSSPNSAWTLRLSLTLDTMATVRAGARANRRVPTMRAQPLTCSCSRPLITSWPA